MHIWVSVTVKMQIFFFNSTPTECVANCMFTVHKVPALSQYDDAYIGWHSCIVMPTFGQTN